MAKTEKFTIDDLIPDDLNANKGNEEGCLLIENSIGKFGLGRSILIDKNNHIIAGNKTTQNAEKVGIRNVRIIETDGTEIIAVKRTDIDLNTKIGRELALADNATAKMNIEWDADVIEKLKENFDIDSSDWGVEFENYANGVDANNMTDNDINLDEQFDPIGNSSDLQRVVFIFDNKEHAESYLAKNKINDYSKKGSAWQVNMSIQSI